LQLSPILDNPDAEFTLFAPNDDAFTKIGGALELLTQEQIIDILLFHVTSGTTTFDELICFSSLLMANDQFTFTDCLKEGNKFQVGPGNTPDHKPEIIVPDIFLCNGIVHVVDNVILPAVPTDMPSAAPSPGPSPEVRCWFVITLLVLN
jgi:transforming growth factor-beta-induced protein